MSFKIEWSSGSKYRGAGEKLVGVLIRKLAERLAPQATGIAISYVDNRKMRKLNRAYKDLNKTTEILVVPASSKQKESHHLGQITISLELADKKAKHFGVSRCRQIESLLIRGFLHLCGLDKDPAEMATLQGTLERELLGSDVIVAVRKRGRRPGSKLKKLKSGLKVVVTGRAAQAIVRREKLEKEKSLTKAALIAKKLKKKAKSKRNIKDVLAISKRKPGRPRKGSGEIAPNGEKISLKRRVRRKPVLVFRPGVIA